MIWKMHRKKLDKFMWISPLATLFWGDSTLVWRLVLRCRVVRITAVINFCIFELFFDFSIYCSQINWILAEFHWELLVFLQFVFFSRENACPGKPFRDVHSFQHLPSRKFVAQVLLRSSWWFQPESSDSGTEVVHAFQQFPNWPFEKKARQETGFCGFVFFYSTGALEQEVF